MSFLKYLLLLAVIYFFMPASVHAQEDMMAGTPYTAVFEIEPRGRPDQIESKFRFNQVYDTNLISTPTGHLDGTYTNMEADVSYIHQQPGSIFMLTYRGGGNVYPQSQYTGLTSGLNAVRGLVRKNLTKRLSMKLVGDWADAPGGAFEESNGQVIGGGDQNTEFLARRHVSYDAILSLQYQTTPHTYFAFGGNIYDIRFEPATLAPSRAEEAFASYYYQFTRSQTISVGFANQWIGFPGTGVHSQVHNVLATYSNSLTPSLTFTGYVGPAFVDEFTGSGPATNPGTITETQRTSVVGGAAVKWVLGHNNIVARYDRLYSRGSGEAGTTLRQIAAVSVSHSISRHLVLALHLNYTTNDLVTTSIKGNSNYRIQPTFRYHLTSRMWLTGSEGYVHAFGLSANAGTLDRSITQFGIEYDLPNFILEK